MPFHPEPNQKINIDGVEYRIAEHPAAPGMPYGQEGRAAIVYQLLSDQGSFALKVFKPRFRTPSLVSQADQIAQYASLPGLQVCKRMVLTPFRYEDLLREHSDLTYAVVMPWIEGYTWQEIVLAKKPLTPEQSLGLARELTRTLAMMEERSLAHCDISGSNLILAPDFATVSLVDVEGLHAPNLLRPKELPGGSPGYAHKTAPDGLWSTEADRFAGAIMLAEMLAASQPAVMKEKRGESYFDPQEMQKDCLRSQTMAAGLRQGWGDAVGQLFTRAWHSDRLSECPTFGEWMMALPEKPLMRVAEEIMEQSQKPEGGGSLVQSLLAVGRQLEEQGNVQGAIGVYRQALSLYPAGDGQGQEIRFILERLEKRAVTTTVQTPAMEKVQPQPARDSETERLFDEGLAAYQKQEWKRAVELLEEAEKRSPGYRRGYVTVVKVLQDIRFNEKRTREKGRKRRKWLAKAVGGLALLTIVISVSLKLYYDGNPVEVSPVPIPPPCTEVGQEWVSPMDRMMQLCVPAGEFLMGSVSSDAHAQDEEPQHTVYLEAFWIDQTEVTNGMYKKCVSAGGCTARSVSGGYTHPVVNVSWFDAEKYCEWAGRQLPSEAQWEKAARGTEGWIYPWGNIDPSSSGPYIGSNEGDTTAVGSHPYGASPYGALDMAGNVWEWVADWYGENYYFSPQRSNPMGPNSGDFRVLRGGSWPNYSKDVRTALRRSYDPDNRTDNIGFRCSALP